jgi:hypothetical protein
MGSAREEQDPSWLFDAEPLPEPVPAGAKAVTRGAASGRSYWLILFSAASWRQFRDDGARVVGFRQRMRSAALRIKPGDTLICYMAGVSRWVGTLRVVAPSEDRDRRGRESEFPVRYAVQAQLLLDAETGIPVEELQGKVEFYKSAEQRSKLKNFLRANPNPFKQEADAELIVRMLRAAQDNPVIRPVAEGKLRNRPMYSAERIVNRKRTPAVVSIPPATNDENAPPSVETVRGGTRRFDIQVALLRLGEDLGLDQWVPAADRGRSGAGRSLEHHPGLLTEIPAQANDALGRTFELTDALWLRKGVVVAAFHIATDRWSIGNALLRAGDLFALNPKLQLPVYMVAPGEVRNQIEEELLRPTFAFREPTLASVCGFLSYTTLTEKVEGIRKLGIVGALKPDFLADLAEFFHEDEAAP